MGPSCCVYSTSQRTRALWTFIEYVVVRMDWWMVLRSPRLIPIETDGWAVGRWKASMIQVEWRILRWTFNDEGGNVVPLLRCRSWCSCCCWQEGWAGSNIGDAFWRRICRYQIFLALARICNLSWFVLCHLCFVLAYLTSSHLVSSYVTSFHRISCHVISPHIMSPHLISCHVISSQINFTFPSLPILTLFLPLLYLFPNLISSIIPCLIPYLTLLFAASYSFW